MIFAARKLQNIGLIFLLTFCALIVYPVSLQVSSTQSELRQVEQEIAAARLRNRMIEGDIAVVANAAQLDHWNRELVGYSTPAPGQYLSGERAIASVERLRPLRSPDRDERVLLASVEATVPVEVGNEVQGTEPQRLDAIASANVSLIPAGALQ